VVVEYVEEGVIPVEFVAQESPPHRELVDDAAVYPEM
jgi:hypothetical protein